MQGRPLPCWATAAANASEMQALLTSSGRGCTTTACRFRVQGGLGASRGDALNTWSNRHTSSSAASNSCNSMLGTNPHQKRCQL